MRPAAVAAAAGPPAQRRRTSGRWVRGVCVCGYSFVRALGAGSFSTVYLAAREGKEYAVKALRPSAQAAAEVRVLRDLSHPHIVALID
eukprot:gene6527-4458_t